MRFTRVKTAELQAAVAQSIVKIDEIAALLAPFLVVITAEERAVTPRVRDGFPDAARSLSRAIVDHPTVAAAADYDTEAVNEDLDNVTVLAPLVEKFTELGQRISDSKLVWQAEAWVPSLAAYAVAKAVARTNGALRTVVDPLAAIFATYRSKASKEEPK